MELYFLAFIIASAVETLPPEIVSMHRSQDACHAEAMIANKKHPVMQNPEAVKLGAQFVCLKTEFTGA
jgi:hypothetical protein